MFMVKGQMSRSLVTT